ncbi:MAG: hypothetical protein CME21_15770 [Gemmatimonadetes bacterium]|nr:hypothetical protein [Gemmatimonadota bacterium]
MADKKFRAGAAMADITPCETLPNYNNMPITYDPDMSPLCCHAVVFEDGETQGAILSIDTAFIDRALMLMIRDTCERATGIPAQNILVSATHTHAAPASCPSFISGATPDPLYVDVLVLGAVEAVIKANSELRAAFIKAVNCPSPGYERNRRLIRPNGLVVMSSANNADDSFHAAGPTDPVMPILAFTDSGGYPLGIVTNYACHNNCVNGVYHADIGGRIGDALRKRFGPQLVTPFIEAPCADVIWHGPEDGPNCGNELAELIGKSACEGITVALESTPLTPVEGIVIRSQVEDYPDRLHEESTFCHDDSRGDTEEIRTTQRRRYDPEEAAVKARGETTCPVEIMGISFGDTAIVTNPAELFAAFGIEIKERSPFDVTLVAELTNGYCGYVGTEKAFEEQGYEVHRTVYTSRLSKDSGRRMTDRSVQILEELHLPEWELTKRLQ